MKRIWLSVKDFTFSDNVAGQESILATVQIPRREVYILDPDRALGFQIPAEESFSATSDGTTGDVTVTLSGTPVVPAWVSGVTDVMKVYWAGTTSTWVSSFTYDSSANTVTFSCPDGAGASGTVYVYYLAGDGEWKLYLEYGGGHLGSTNAQKALVMNSLIEMTNLTQDVSSKTAEHFPGKYIMVPNMNLSIYVDTNQKIKFYGPDNKPLSLGVIKFPVVVEDLEVIETEVPTFVKDVLRQTFSI